jgi:1-acyl-sn-glycerol-3-phosphate acyltransferase
VSAGGANPQAAAGAAYAGLKLARLAFSLGGAFVAFKRRGLGSAPLADRADWMSRTSRKCLRALGVSTRLEGSLPQGGILAANHLGYLDILLLGSFGPMIFVSKADVVAWPVFGNLATKAGTIYVNRESRSAVGETTRAIDATLAAGLPVVIFPEGTSSDGSSILPFRSSLLEPAAGKPGLAVPAHLGYDLPGGDVGRQVCYWGEMVFVPHLVGLARTRGVVGSVRVGLPVAEALDRKALARRLRAEVEALAPVPPRAASPDS